MRIKARTLLPLFALALAAGPHAGAQQKADDKKAPAPAAASAPPAATGKGAPVITAGSTPIELARAAYLAQGGEKWRALKNMLLTGTVDLYSPNSTQSLAGRFGVIFAGERQRMNIQSPLFSLEMINDGQRSYSSMRGFEIPPPDKYGILLLAKFDQPGYTVTALPDKKKERAFRITGAEGNATSFYVDAATGRVTRYEINLDGLPFTVEYKAVKEFDGVLVPTSFGMRLDAPQGAFYSEFKDKEVKLNQRLPADAFAIPNQ